MVSYKSHIAKLQMLIICILAISACTFGQTKICNLEQSPRTTGNVSYGPSNNWSTVNRILEQDDDHASVSLLAGQDSKYVRIREFAFLVPDYANIIGAKVTVVRKADASANMFDKSVRLTIDETAMGDEKANTSLAWTSSNTTVTYGDSLDDWGLGLTPSMVNNADFGVLVSVNRTTGSGSKKAYIDYLTLRITYEVPFSKACLESLPIDLISFQGKQSNSTNYLTWKTASEDNISHFVVQRSTDGINYNDISIVKANGGQKLNSYNFQDKNSAKGKAYYRLLYVDMQGVAANYGKIISLNSAVLNTNVYPNPYQEGNSLMLNLEQSDLVGPISLSIVNATGTAILNNTTIDSGLSQIDISNYLANQPNGMYNIQVSSLDGMQNLKLIKQ